MIRTKLNTKNKLFVLKEKMRKMSIIALLLAVMFQWDILSALELGRYEDEPIFGGTFYFEEHGSKNRLSLVLCHGTGDLGAKIWDEDIKYLAESYRVYAFDFPGFGRSEQKNELYSPENYARFLKWFIDTYTTAPVYVIGHSMGGAISLYFAGMYPDSLDRLILVDAAGILHRAAFTKNMLDGLISGELKVGNKDLLEGPISSLKYLMNSTIESFDSSLMPDDMSSTLNIKLFREKALSGDPIRISAMAMIHTDFSRILGKVKAPTYIIWGEKDPIAPLRTGFLLATNIQKSYLAVLPGLEHSPMLEDPATFRRILLKSLAQGEIKPFDKIRQKPFLSSNRANKEVVKGNGIIIQGDFDLLEIKDSNYVNIENTTANRIIIDNSNVNIKNSVIRSQQTGIYVKNSILRLTGVSVYGNTAIKTNNSDLDIAGSYLQGQDSSLESEFKSTVLFSVSQVDSPYQSIYVHTVIKLFLGNKY
ncbi:alpha/beta hydrolase [bacterium]|nr:alpha/beta hydrolase [bacterium]